MVGDSDGIIEKSDANAYLSRDIVSTSNLDVNADHYRTSKTLPKYSTPTRMRITKSPTAKKAYTSRDCRWSNEKSMEASTKRYKKDPSGSVRKFQSMRMELERYKSININSSENRVEIRDEAEKDNNFPDYLRNDSEGTYQRRFSSKIIDERDQSEPINKSEEAWHNFYPDDDFSLTEDKNVNREKSFNRQVDADSSTKEDDYLKNSCEITKPAVNVRKLCANHHSIENNEEKNIEEESNSKEESKFKFESDEEVAASNDSLKNHHVAQPGANVSENSHITPKLSQSYEESDPITEQENEEEESQGVLEKNVFLSKHDECCYAKEKITKKETNLEYEMEIDSYGKNDPLTDLRENIKLDADSFETSTTIQTDLIGTNHPTFDEQGAEERDEIEFEIYRDNVIKESNYDWHDKDEEEDTNDNRMENYEMDYVTEPYKSTKEISIQTDFFELTKESGTQTNFNEMKKESSTQANFNSEFEQELLNKNQNLELIIESSKMANESLLTKYATEKETSALLIAELERALSDANAKVEEENNAFKTVLEELGGERTRNRMRLYEMEHMLINSNLKVEEMTTGREMDKSRINELEQSLENSNQKLKEISLENENNIMRINDSEQSLLVSNQKVEKISTENESNSMRINELDLLLINLNQKIEKIRSEKDLKLITSTLNIEEVNKETEREHDVQMKELTNANKIYLNQIADLEKSIDDVGTNLEEKIEVAKIENEVLMKELIWDRSRYSNQIAHLEQSFADVYVNLKENKLNKIDHDDQIACLQKSNEIQIKEKVKEINELLEEKRIRDREFLNLKESLMAVNEKFEIETIEQRITLHGQVTDLQNSLHDKNQQLDRSLTELDSEKLLHVQAQNSIAIASSEISSLKQSLEDKQELACFLTQESAILEKSYSETKTIVDLNNAKLKTLIEEKEKLEMQFCQIQKMTTESIMSEQGKLSCKNNELSSCKEHMSELEAEIMEEKVTMENLICVIEALYHTISDNNNENEDSDDRCVYDMVKTVSTINQEKDSKIKILQAHVEAMKCSLKIEEENSQKLWEVISSLELSLNESTSKAEDMSNKVSLLQTLVIDKNDELMRLNEVFDAKEVTLSSLEKLATSNWTSVSNLENILHDVQEENDSNKGLCKWYMEKIAVLEGEINSVEEYVSKHARKNDNYENLVDNLRILVSERESEICGLAKRLDNEISCKEKSMEEIEVTMNRKVGQISRDALERNVYMEGQIEVMRSKLDDACNKNYKNETQITFFKTELGQRDAQLKNLNAKLAFVVKNSSSKVEENEKLLKKLEQSLKKAYSELKNLEDQLSDATKERDDALDNLLDKEEVQNELLIVIRKLNVENQNLSDKLHQYDEQLNKKLQDAGASISTMKGFFSSLEAMICEKDKKISEISEELANSKSEYEEQTKLYEEKNKASQTMVEELEVLKDAHDRNKQENSAIIIQLRNAIQEMSSKLYESRTFSDSMVKKTFNLQSAIDEVNRDLRKTKEVIVKQDKVIETLQAKLGTKENISTEKLATSDI